ncbi:hypothetical protein C8R44DRAFT_747783 [Mycena epipterygia]|nr:hypothetical protein C8R44DRAFT_747783 [Mycena epipterygia]
MANAMASVGHTPFKRHEPTAVGLARSGMSAFAALQGMCSWILSESAWKHMRGRSAEGERIGQRRRWGIAGMEKHTHCALITVAVINPARGARLRFTFSVCTASAACGGGGIREVGICTEHGRREGQLSDATPDAVRWQVYKSSTGNKSTEIKSAWQVCQTKNDRSGYEETTSAVWEHAGSRA